MKKKVIKIIQSQIEKLYCESKELILLPTSYNAELIDFENVNRYISFIEGSLKKPYNRLCALSVFITDAEQSRADLMYPFALLSSKAKNAIGEKEAESIKLAEALDVGEISCGYTVLWREEHLVTEVQ